MERVTFAGLAKRFAAMPEIVHAEIEIGLKTAAMKVRDTATRKFGTYQVAVGDYPAWEQLKESTIKAKTAAGGGEDPLIGHYSGSSGNKVWPAPLRNTIGMKVEGWTAQVGSDDPLMRIHEFGAPSTDPENPVEAAGKNHDIVIPPRPVLRPALFENIKFVRSSLELAMQKAIRRL